MRVLTHQPRTSVYYWPRIHDRANIELQAPYPYALQGLGAQQLALLDINAQNQITGATQIPWSYIVGGVVVLLVLMK